MDSISCLVRSEGDITELVYQLVIPFQYTIFNNMLSHVASTVDSKQEIIDSFSKILNTVTTWNSIVLQDVLSPYKKHGKQLINYIKKLALLKIKILQQSGIVDQNRHFQEPTIDFTMIMHVIIIHVAYAINQNVYLMVEDNSTNNFEAVVRENNTIEKAVVEILSRFYDDALFEKSQNTKKSRTKIAEKLNKTNKISIIGSVPSDEDEFDEDEHTGSVHEHDYDNNDIPDIGPSVMETINQSIISDTAPVTIGHDESAVSASSEPSSVVASVEQQPSSQSQVGKLSPAMIKLMQQL
jgi:hypothetical protein